MEEAKTNAGQGLGIAGLIMGILAIPLAVLGCTSVLGLLLGGAGITLSAIGLSQASKSNGMKGLPTGGLVVSLAGTFIALLMLVFLAQVVHSGQKWWTREGRQLIQQLDQIDEGVGEDLENAFEDFGDDMQQIGDELEMKLENLEWDEQWENFEWGDEISDEEFEKVLGAYQSLITEYAELVEKADEGNLSALADYAMVSARAMALGAKIVAVAPRLTEEQQAQFEELQMKYEEMPQVTPGESGQE